ncbi:MAG: hypothetical protein AB7E81_23390 [Hyphomicrobiaceae bacterium]
MVRKVIALAGLLCMLLHAGFSVLHHVAPIARASAALEAGSVSSERSELAQALLASMCRPAGISAVGETLPVPSLPTDGKGPCLICCCPVAAAMLPPLPSRCPHPGTEPQQNHIVSLARLILIQARVAERPPVRGPPAAA